MAILSPIDLKHKSSRGFKSHEETSVKASEIDPLRMAFGLDNQNIQQDKKRISGLKGKLFAWPRRIQSIAL